MSSTKRSRRPITRSSFAGLRTACASGIVPDQTCAVRLPHSSQQSSHQRLRGGRGRHQGSSPTWCASLRPAHADLLARVRTRHFARALGALYDGAEGCGRRHRADADPRRSNAICSKWTTCSRRPKSAREQPADALAPDRRGAPGRADQRSCGNPGVDRRADAHRLGSHRNRLRIGRRFATGVALRISTRPGGCARSGLISPIAHEAMAINNCAAHQLPAIGSWSCTPGRCLPPTHLEHHHKCALRPERRMQLCAPLGGLCSDRLVPTSSRRRTTANSRYVAPFGPLDSLAFTRDLIDRSGSFNERQHTFLAEWEILHARGDLIEASWPSIRRSRCHGATPASRFKSSTSCRPWRGSALRDVPDRR